MFIKLIPHKATDAEINFSKSLLAGFAIRVGWLEICKSDSKKIIDILKGTFLDENCQDYYLGTADKKELLKLLLKTAIKFLEQKHEKNYVYNIHILYSNFQNILQHLSKKFPEFKIPLSEIYLDNISKTLDSGIRQDFLDKFFNLFYIKLLEEKPVHILAQDSLLVQKSLNKRIMKIKNFLSGIPEDKVEHKTVFLINLLKNNSWAEIEDYLEIKEELSS